MKSKITKEKLNIRLSAGRYKEPVGFLPIGYKLNYESEVEGEDINGNSTWLKDEQGFYYWRGGTDDEKSKEGRNSLIKYWHSDYGIEEIWKVSKGRNVRVALIDSGVDSLKKDLHLTVDRHIDYYQNNGDGIDEYGHGTNCAGIIGGKGLEEILGVAPECTVDSIKIYKSVNPSNKLLKEALKWIINQPVDTRPDIVSMPIDVGKYDDETISLFDSLKKLNIIPIAAIGNKDPEYDGPPIGARVPAAIESCLSIGALNTNATLSNYTIRDQKLNICVPSEKMEWYRNFGNVASTSMATAFFAGTLALFIEHFRNNGIDYNLDYIKNLCDKISEKKIDNSGFQYKALVKLKILNQFKTT